MENIGYTLLVIALLWFMYDSHKQRKRNIVQRWRTHTESASAALAWELYILAERTNRDMAEALEQYRSTFGELLDEQPADVPPVMSPDEAIANMKYCLACMTYRHDNHFTLYPMHAHGVPPK